MSLIFKYKIVVIAAFLSLITATPSLSQYTDNPGGDQPDESSNLGDAIYPTNLEGISLNPDKKSKVAVFDNGYSREAGLFLSLYLPVRILMETEIPIHASSLSLLVIPSGGLSSLKDPDGFRTTLNKFVEGGGVLFVFSQRFGSDYALLPDPDGQSIRAYGWLEDQSSLSHSAIMTMQHSIVSRLVTSRPHLNIDGFFETFPDNSKHLLRNSLNGQPVMLIYKHGKGSVIATTMFTDWAYLHLRATWDEIALFSGIFRWLGLSVNSSVPQAPVIKRNTPVSPEALPAVGLSLQSDNEVYTAGSNATFTVRLWNNEDRERKIKVYYDGIGKYVELQPHSSDHITYLTPVYSSRRLWVYFFDENEIFLQTLKRGYSVIYPEQ